MASGLAPRKVICPCKSGGYVKAKGNANVALGVDVRRNIYFEQFSAQLPGDAKGDDQWNLLVVQFTMHDDNVAKDVPFISTVRA